MTPEERRQFVLQAGGVSMAPAAPTAVEKRPAAPRIRPKPKTIRKSSSRSLGIPANKLRLEEAAKFLGVSYSTLYRYARIGRINEEQFYVTKPLRGGRRYILVYDKKELEALKADRATSKRSLKRSTNILRLAYLLTAVQIIKEDESAVYTKEELKQAADAKFAEQCREVADSDILGITGYGDRHWTTDVRNRARSLLLYYE